MRPFSIVLVLSIAANVALAVAVCFVQPDIAPASAPATAAQPKPEKRKITADPELLATAIQADDAKTIFEQLCAMGIGENAARSYAEPVIWKKYYSRQRELQLALRNTHETPYWSGLDKTISQYTAKERAELRELANQARRDSLEKLGMAIPAFDERPDVRYNFLSQEKMAKVLAMDRDYDEMYRELNGEATRFRVASDTEKLRLLREEQRRDLVATLTPEELAAYDQRFSSTARTAQRFLAGIDTTEAEYLAVYNMLKPVYDMPENPGAVSREEMMARAEAYKKLPGEIKNILGEARYADYVRAQNSDYANLQAAADRFRISAATVNAVYNLRDSASAESQRIAADPELSTRDKRDALKNLADTIRGQIRSQLGDEVGDAYLKANMTWLQRVSDGASVDFQSGNARYKQVTPPVPSKGARTPVRKN